MMTLKEIEQMLSGITGFSGKVAYRNFPVEKTPLMPFIVYLESYSSNFGADNRVYHTINHLQIELYSRKKDSVSEGLVETALNNNYIYWEKSEFYLTDEKCYQVIYEINN